MKYKTFVIIILEFTRTCCGSNLEGIADPNSGNYLFIQHFKSRVNHTNFNLRLCLAALICAFTHCTFYFATHSKCVPGHDCCQVSFTGQNNLVQGLKMETKEPKLTYERILNDVSASVQTDFITAACLHPKFIIVGYNTGRLNIFDHQGNKTNTKNLCLHMNPVNCVSVDKRGNYFVSCSDESLVVYGLCDDTYNHVMMLDKPVKLVAIDPGDKKRYVTDGDGLFLHKIKKSYIDKLKGDKPLVLWDEKPIRALSWCGKFIACATDQVIKVFYDPPRPYCAITKIRRGPENTGQDPAQLAWKDERTLIVGWGPNIKFYTIRDRPLDQLAEGVPECYAVRVITFNTDYAIHGLAPLNENLLTMTIHPHDRQLQIQVLSVFADDNYDELYGELVEPRTAISSNSSRPVPSTASLKNSMLLSLHTDGIYMMVCPQDIILAKPRDSDDHFEWLIEHKKYQECYDFAAKNPDKLVRHSLREIEKLYIDEIMDDKNPEKLSQLDPNETALVLVDNVDLMPIDTVIDRLKRHKSREYLMTYLSKILLKYQDSFQEYHDLLVELYAEHQPHSLLGFLKLSTAYHLEEAFDICRNKNLVEEVIFLYTRMGDLHGALRYIMEENGDVHRAEEYCKEHQDQDLWLDLINYTVDKRREWIGVLLKNVVTYLDDPAQLIKRIPPGCEIDEFIPSLKQALLDYDVQIELEKSLRKLQAEGAFKLLQNQLELQSRGILVTDDSLCNQCNQILISKQFKDVLANQNQETEANSSNSVVVFGCHHMFHEDCCRNPDSGLPACCVCMLDEEVE